MSTKEQHKKGLTVAELERQVADTIIAMMERDGLRWTKSWVSPRPARNAITGHVYSGMNVFMTGLWLVVNAQEDARFLTFKQGREIGAKLTKGSKGIPIMFFKQLRSEDDDGKVRRGAVARLSYVFHVSQFEEIDETKLVPVGEQLAEVDESFKIDEIDQFISNADVRTSYDGTAAFYNEGIDTVVMPKFGAFRDTDEASANINFYGTLLHECIHWTGAKKRLDRETMRLYHAKKTERAKEELIAEIGSAMLCQRFQITPAPTEDNAAYIASWCRLLDDKPGEIFRAASAAAKAIQFMDELQPQPMAEAAE